MFKTLTVALAAATLLVFCGCPSKKTPPEGTEPAATGKCPAATKSMAFSVAWCTDADPATAAKTAATEAIEGLGCPPKGLIFYEYYPKTVKDADGKDKELPDAEKDKLVLPAIRGVAASVPTIGCRARSLVTGGTMLKDTVAVMAIGGEKLSCKVASAKLMDDRKAVGVSIAEQLKDVKDLKLVFALSEMSLSFETKEGVSVEDFIRGIVDTCGKEVALFGGNCMPDDYPDDRSGVQFLDDEVLEGCVVAMGIGGPVAVHANHTNEFDPSDQTVTVTKAEDKWVLEFDGKPAADVYRQVRGMKPEDEFTSDSQHPIGVIVTEDKVYLRMVLEEDKARKALRFVAAVPQRTKVKVLKGGFDAQKILDSAANGIKESFQKAGDAQPLVVLLADCCARGGRLRQFRKADECEVKLAIIPAMGEKKGCPIFGFYAWGELGPIAGPFEGLNCMYQQHTFVSAVLTEEQ